MDVSVFERFRGIIYEHSGISLSPEKKPLLSNRLQRRLRELGLRNEREYLQIVETDDTGEELWKLIEAVSTNTTHFYREPQHFVTLGKVLREWVAAGKRHIKIWCAAASSGEEPYTLAFQVAESVDLREVEVKILATDINTKVLRHAASGVYGAQRVSSIPPEIRERYMLPLDDGAQFMVRPEIRSLILFKRLNLVEIPYPLRGSIDIIFCRNVMIYFDLPTRAKIVHEFERQLTKPGLLFLSHSESLIGIEHNLSRYDSSVFLNGRQW